MCLPFVSAPFVVGADARFYYKVSARADAHQTAYVTITTFFRRLITVCCLYYFSIITLFFSPSLSLSLEIKVFNKRKTELDKEMAKRHCVGEARTEEREARERETTGRNGNKSGTACFVQITAQYAKNTTRDELP